MLLGHMLQTLNVSLPLYLRQLCHLLPSGEGLQGLKVTKQYIASMTEDDSLHRSLEHPQTLMDPSLPLPAPEVASLCPVTEIHDTTCDRDT